MHCYVNTFFLRNDELLAILKVVHVPELDLTVRRSSRNLIVLVKRIKLILLFVDIEFGRRNILEVSSTYFHLRIVARLQT